jgi:transposase-like protein
MLVATQSKSLPSLFDIVELLTNEEAAKRFILQRKILYAKPLCSACGGPTKRKRDLWACIKKSCAKTISIHHGSFFMHSNLKCNQTLIVTYLWLSKVKVNSIITMTGHSSGTIAAYIKHLNQVVAGDVDEEDCSVGGDQVVVEIDECKIAKRKYHRGHRVEGAWVVGGVERTELRKVFVEVVEDRSAVTLRDIISRRVKPGSIVHTDLWRGYSNLEDFGVTHETVNHSLHFKDPMTGIHTNTIEGTWSGLKHHIPIRNRNRGSVEEHLLTFIWRRQNSSRLWDVFFVALANTHYCE